MTRTLRNFILVTVVIIASGCVCRVGVPREQTFLTDSPNPEKAYLVMGVRSALPDRENPTWIGIADYCYIAHLSTSSSIFELEPSTRRIDHLDYQADSSSGDGTFGFRRARVFDLEPGVIHYYGVLELEQEKRGLRVRTVHDEELLASACDSAPEVFRQFPISVVGPLAKQGLADLSCNGDFAKQPSVAQDQDY